MKESLRELLERDFFSNLPNKQIENKAKYIITFAGLPKSGKSHLSDEISKKYGALLIRKDVPRQIIIKNGTSGPLETEEILDVYFQEVEEKIFNLPNKLIVVDASVDKRFDYYRKWGDRYDYQLFVIELDTSLDKVKENIEKIEVEETRRWFFEQIPRWENDHKNFIRTHKVDFTIKNNSKEDIGELFGVLDREIRQHNS